MATELSNDEFDAVRIIRVPAPRGGQHTSIPTEIFNDPLTTVASWGVFAWMYTQPNPFAITLAQLEAAHPTNTSDDLQAALDILEQGGYIAKYFSGFRPH